VVVPLGAEQPQRADRRRLGVRTALRVQERKQVGETCRARREEVDGPRVVFAQREIGEELRFLKAVGNGVAEGEVVLLRRVELRIGRRLRRCGKAERNEAEQPPRR
jgi:hypothetical protein